MIIRPNTITWISHLRNTTYDPDCRESWSGYGLNFISSMSLKKNKDLKLYFSISEVAQMFDVNESTLRFWEKEFDIINPRKTSKGTRFYKQEDIDAVRLIYHLVKERGMT